MLEEGSWNEVEKDIDKVEDEHERLVREKLPQREHWQEHLLSIPTMEKGAPPVVTIPVDGDSYDAIVHGKNRRVCVGYTTEWVNKLLLHKLKYVTLVREEVGGSKEESTFRVKDIRILEKLTGKTGNPRNPPKGILPDAFAVNVVTDWEMFVIVVAIMAVIGIGAWCFLG